MKVTKNKRVIMNLPNGRVVSYRLLGVMEVTGLSRGEIMRLEPSDTIRRGNINNTILEWCEFYAMTPHVVRAGTLTEFKKGI